MQKAVFARSDCETSYTDAINFLRDRVDSLEHPGDQIVHLCVDLEPVNMLAFLAANPQHAHTFWRGRNGDYSLAGLDYCRDIVAAKPLALAEVEQLSRRVCSDSLDAYQPRFVGGFSFNGQQGSGIWSDVPASRFVLPEIGLVKEGERYRLHLHLSADGNDSWQAVKAALQQKLRALRWPAAEVAPLTAEPLARNYHIPPEYWQRCCDAVRGAIAGGDVDKIVLARRLSVALAKPLDSLAFLNEWLVHNPDCYAFLLQFSGKTFVGCSPERLYWRSGTHLSTESLAGTVLRGQDAQDDAVLSQALLRQSKLVRERELVTEFICRTLQPCSQQLRCGDAEVMTLDRVQHGYQRIEATLHAGVTDAKLLSALHPTPAVCGYPRAAARDFIQRHEQLDRGWYSGGVGVISGDEVDFAVAIRSALLEEDKLHCFSGVGLVEGSDAEAEWQELDAKLASVLSVLYG